MTEIEKLLKEYLDYLEVEKNRSPKTRENYERYLRHFITQSGVATLRDFTLDKIKEIKRTIARLLTIMPKTAEKLGGVKNK